MASNDICEVQFLLSHPKLTQIPDVQRQAHAHAARVAHARKRRFRVIEYYTSKNRKGSANGYSSTVEPHQGLTKIIPASKIAGAEDEVLPSLINALTSNRRDPFTCFARPFDQTEQHLFDYYIQVVIPYQSTYCNVLWDTEAYKNFMREEWTRLTVTRHYSLDILLLIACRHLARIGLQESEEQQHYLKLAVKYKLSCVRALNDTISAEIMSIISNATIATVLGLVCDELWLGDHSTAKSHLLGALNMIKHNGGPQTLGLNGFLEHLTHRFWRGLEYGEMCGP